ncbi:S41 family peptidase [Tenacibaculum retecalamus]|uniref:S41 family peptidase n=1 Tax=Tenacibaculum retecalamus TaxID=3018315 RepID=UPI0023D91255|nr:S41 family peptidase [Tenacibaculum retecalamus]WBX72312.1 S41 family peptidase [Tenacibaculum retecalamus]
MKNIFTLLLLMITGNAFSQMPNTLSKSEKVYGLSKFWQEVNYNFVYLYKVDEEKWKNKYKSLIAEVQETKNDYEYYRLLQKFCASLKDGHTNIFIPEDIKSNLQNTNFGNYRLFLTNVDNKAIVTRTNLSKKDEIPIGSEIIKVNGMDTKNYLEKEVLPFTSSSTNYVLMDRAIWKMFEAPIGTSFDVTFKLPNGKIKELKLTHSVTTEQEVYPKFENRQLFEFRWIDKNIAYIALNSFEDSEINNLFIKKIPELYKAKKLIVDLRNNGGGSEGIGLKILQYFIKDSVVYGSKSQSRLHIPTYKAWGKFITAKDTLSDKPEWNMTKDELAKSFLIAKGAFTYKFSIEPDFIVLNKKRIIIPTAVLIGHNTASAAEDFLIYADDQKHFKKIGEPTFGSTGQPLYFELPGSGSARICTKKDTYPNGKEFVGYGIQPDIEVKKS